MCYVFFFIKLILKKYTSKKYSSLRLSVIDELVICLYYRHQTSSRTLYMIHSKRCRKNIWFLVLLQKVLRSCYDFFLSQGQIKPKMEYYYHISGWNYPILTAFICYTHSVSNIVQYCLLQFFGIPAQLNGYSTIL